MSATETFDLDESDRKLIASLNASQNEPLRLLVDGRTVTLPPDASHAVARLLAGLATGSSVYVLTDDDELTTQQAADILGISRTYVVRLIDQGNLPARHVGTHRRLRAVDVLAYRRQRDDRLAAVAAISSADDEFGIAR